MSLGLYKATSGLMAETWNGRTTEYSGTSSAASTPASAGEAGTSVFSVLGLIALFGSIALMLYMSTSSSPLEDLLGFSVFGGRIDIIFFMPPVQLVLVLLALLAGGTIFGAVAYLMEIAIDGAIALVAPSRRERGDDAGDAGPPTQS